MPKIGNKFQATVALDNLGTHVGGQTIAVSIQKVSNGFWFDFFDSTFKSTGWTNKTANMTEDAVNHQYTYAWTPPGSETTDENYIFHYENSGGYGFIKAETVEYYTTGGGGNVTVGGYAAGQDPATYVLATPANKLATDATGKVTVGVNSDKTGYVLSAQGDSDVAGAVWGAATRTLTSGANIALAKGTGVTGFNDIAAADILTSALVEAYAVDGTAFTLSQALYMIWSALSEFAVSGTTITAKKLDGVTAAMTFTMDSATTPTSRTRAT